MNIHLLHYLIICLINKGSWLRYVCNTCAARSEMGPFLVLVKFRLYIPLSLCLPQCGLLLLFLRWQLFREFDARFGFCRLSWPACALLIRDVYTAATTLTRIGSRYRHFVPVALLYTLSCKCHSSSVRSFVISREFIVAFYNI